MPQITDWLFHIPNFLLAAMMYTLVGRLILSLFAPPGWKNYIWRAFVFITEPALRATRAVTPDVVPPTVLPVFAFLWLMLLRIVLFVVLANLGLLSFINQPVGMP